MDMLRPTASFKRWAEGSTLLHEFREEDKVSQARTSYGWRWNTYGAFLPSGAEACQRQSHAVRATGD